MMKRKKRAGFSLVEVVIVIAIIGTLVAVATPSMSRWLPNKRMKAAARDIASAVALAKAEAIRRDARVALIFPTPLGKSGYDVNAPLYRMFVDNGKGPVDKDTGEADDVGEENGELDDGEVVLMEGPALPARILLRANSFSKFTLVFNSRGLPVGASGGIGGGAIRLCTADGRNQPSDNCRTVTVSTAGRIVVGVGYN